MSLHLPGLPAPEGVDPAARRHALAALGEEVLAAQITELALAARAVARSELEALAAAVGLPLGEVLASPFALRAVVLAAARGATTVHHELRVPLEWPGAWQAGEAVAEEGHATWERGVLRTGKYQSFLQDEPLATYNPAHMSKWAPHELMHRAVGFFWRADMTRWELYLGARLNELVPVVLWYGLDEVLRLDREGFERERDQRAPEAPLERARWLTEPVTSVRERARRSVRFVREALAHLERELCALDEELANGRQVVVPHAFLDASSDAAAYVVGHWGRLRSSPFRELVEGLLIAGRDYEDSVWRYRERVEQTFDELVFGRLEWSQPLTRARSGGRRLWDWLGRVAQCGSDYFESVRDWLPEARADFERAQNGNLPDLAAWGRRLLEALPDPDPLAAGTLEDAPQRALTQLLDGLESVVPATTRLLDRVGELDEWLVRFIGSRDFSRRAPLALRVEAFTSQTGAPALVRDLLSFELALLRATRRDDQVERLSPAPDELAGELTSGRLVANAGFALHRFDHDVARLHAILLEDRRLEALPGPEAVTYLIGCHFDEVVVVPAPLGLSLVWERLASAATPVGDAIAMLADVDLPAVEGDWPESAGSWAQELLMAGAVGWVPDL